MVLISRHHAVAVCEWRKSTKYEDRWQQFWGKLLNLRLSIFFLIYTLKPFWITLRISLNKKKSTLDKYVYSYFKSVCICVNDYGVFCLLEYSWIVSVGEYVENVRVGVRERMKTNWECKCHYDSYKNAIQDSFPGNLYFYFLLFFRDSSKETG